MPDNKSFMTIEDYISSFPAHIQVILQNVRQAIRKAAPEATETISYGMPTYDLDGKHLVFFAGWKHHVAVYPLPAGDDAFQQKIAPYKRVKSTIQLPIDRPIPYNLVSELVTFLKSEKPESDDSAGPLDAMQ